MKFKQVLFMLTIVVSIIFVSVIGASYAYYATSSGSVELTTGSFPQNSVTVSFQDGNYIDINTMIPIAASDVTTEAVASNFTLTPNMNIVESYDIGVSIALSNIDIDSALQISNFKYRLVCKDKVNYVGGTVSYGSEQQFSGTGTSLVGNSYSIATLATNETGNNLFIINTDSNVSSQMYECTLYIWLQDTGLNQNSLMNKHFSANIEVDTVAKKR